MSRRHPYPRYLRFSKRDPSLTPSHQPPAGTDKPSISSSSKRSQSLPTHAGAPDYISKKPANNVVLNQELHATLFETIKCNECGFEIPEFVEDYESVKEEGCPVCGGECH